MNNMYKKWRQFLVEVNYALDVDPEEIERARVGVAVAFDRAVLSPKLDNDIKQDIEEEDPEGDAPSDPASWPHITKLKNIVAKGRQVPFLYYAYMGVDPNTGQLMDEKNINSALKLTGTKVLDFIKHFSGNQIGKDVFLSDFHMISERYDEFKQTRADFLSQQGVVQDDDVVRSDAAKYSIGPEMSFSVSSIGAGSKPVSFVNQDFMYKDSPEMHNIPPEHHFVFSPYFPMAMAVFLLYNNLSPSNESELFKIFSTKNIDLEDIYRYAVSYSENHQESTQVPRLSYDEFASNYVDVSTVAAARKRRKDIEDSELMKGTGAVLEGKDLGTFLTRFQMLLQAPVDQYTPQSIDQRYRRLASLVSGELLSELLMVANAYPSKSLQEALPRSIQQKNRQMKKAYPTKLEMIRLESEKEKPATNVVRKATTYISKVDAALEAGQITDAAVNLEQRIQYIQFLRIAQEKLGIEPYPIPVEPEPEGPSYQRIEEDIMELAESFHYLFPLFPDSFKSYIGQKNMRTMSQAYQILVGKGLNRQNNPNSPQFIGQPTPLSEVFRRFL
ncbi:MAG TPA: hypothetical protein DD671_19880 [Balneolaceae bacterium]|nr:hypothetical protein [Balneolaceae bacterium]